jgi:hypothetical protein
MIIAFNEEGKLVKKNKDEVVKDKELFTNFVSYYI